MQIDGEQISKTMDHLTDVHDALLKVQARGIFQLDNYIKVLGRCIDDLAWIKRRSQNAQEYLDRKV